MPKPVPLIEENNLKYAQILIDALLTPLMGKIDILVLEFTHYTVINDFIRKRFKSLNVIS